MRWWTCVSRRNRYRLGMRRAIISTTTVRARMNVMRNASRARRASSSAVGATLSESPDLGRRDVIARHLGPPGPWQQTQPGRRGGAQPADAVAVSRQTIATSASQEADRSGGRFFGLEAYENLGHSHTLKGAELRHLRFRAAFAAARTGDPVRAWWQGSG